MTEITCNVEQCEESGCLLAFWDDPARGGITTQGNDLKELQEMVRDAVSCHFESRTAPQKIRLHS
jgi:hypothetical protein